MGLKSTGVDGRALERLGGILFCGVSAIEARVRFSSLDLQGLLAPVGTVPYTAGTECPVCLLKTMALLCA